MVRVEFIMAQIHDLFPAVYTLITMETNVTIKIYKSTWLTHLLYFVFLFTTKLQYHGNYT